MEIGVSNWSRSRARAISFREGMQPPRVYLI
jgi:hypothetical protein